MIMTGRSLWLNDTVVSLRRYKDGGHVDTPNAPLLAEICFVGWRRNFTSSERKEALPIHVAGDGRRHFVGHSSHISPIRPSGLTKSQLALNNGCIWLATRRRITASPNVGASNSSSSNCQRKWLFLGFCTLFCLLLDGLLPMTCKSTTNHGRINPQVAQ